MHWLILKTDSMSGLASQSEGQNDTQEPIMRKQDFNKVRWNNTQGFPPATTNSDNRYQFITIMRKFE